MLAHPLFEQLKTLRCQGMLEAFQEQLRSPDINRLSFDERFALMLERELCIREDRRLSNRLRQAKLREQACLEDIDYTQERQLSKTVITRLAQCSWIASQLPISTWHDSIGDATLGDAILDRLLHNAHRIEIAGPSMRKNKAKNLAKVEN